VPIYQGGLLAQAFEDSQRGTYKNIQLHVHGRLKFRLIQLPCMDVRSAVYCNTNEADSRVKYV